MKLLMMLCILLFTSCTITGNIVDTLDHSPARDATDRIVEIVHDPGARQQTKVETARNICDEIQSRNLETIAVEDIQSSQDFSHMMESMNTVQREYNKALDTGFADFSGTSFAAFTNQKQQYADLLDDYNAFIKACDVLDENDDTSVSEVYRSGLRFGIRGSFLLTGNSVPLAALQKVIAMCPSCSDII